MWSVVAIKNVSVACSAARNTAKTKGKVANHRRNLPHLSTKIKPGLYQPYKPGLRGECSRPHIAHAATMQFSELL